jgi:hypothetical protein
MRRALTKAFGIVLSVLAAALGWLLVAGASVAAAGGPNPLYLRVAPRPLSPSSSTSALAGALILVAVLLATAVVFALLQRRADRRETLAEVTSLDSQREQDRHHKAA